MYNNNLISCVESLPNEIWRDVLGHEGMYMVSNIGRVKRLSFNKNNKVFSEKLVCASMDNKHGYLSVNLMKNDGGRRNEKLHRVIALAFIPNPNNKTQVNHKNGIRNDNRIENLEWLNSEENISHSIKYLRDIPFSKKVDLSLNEKYFKEKVHDLDGEIWKDVVGYEGIYKISNLGRIKTVKRVFKNIKNKTRTIREKLLRTSYSNGYLQVCLYKTGKAKSINIHVLISKAFIPNPFNKKTVNHKNGVRDDNRIENLEWATYSENIKHSFKVLKRKIGGCYGINNVNRKKVAQYDLDGNLINSFKSLAEAGDYLGVSSMSISRSCNLHEKKGYNTKCHGHMFTFFEKEPILKIKKYENKKRFKISVYDFKTNNLVYDFYSIIEIARKLKADKSSIHKVLRGKQKSHLGYYFIKQKL